MSDLMEFSDGELIEEIFDRNLENDILYDMPFLVLSKFSDEDIIDEAKDRGYLGYPDYSNNYDVLSRLFQNRRNGKPYEHLLDELIAEILGRIL